MREAWLTVLNTHECGSSQWICSEHFTSDDYAVSSNGKIFYLKPDAIPTIFNVVLIEFDDEEFSENDISTDEFDIEKIREIKSQNDKLQQEIEQLKSKLGSEKIFLNSQIEYFKEIKKNQAHEIQKLKREVIQLKCTVDQLTKERDSMIGELNVNAYSLL